MGGPQDKGRSANFFSQRLGNGTIRGSLCAIIRVIAGESGHDSKTGENKWRNRANRTRCDFTQVTKRIVTKTEEIGAKIVKKLLLKCKILQTALRQLSHFLATCRLKATQISRACYDNRIVKCRFKHVACFRFAQQVVRAYDKAKCPLLLRQLASC